MKDHLKARSLLLENAIAEEQYYIINNSIFLF